MTERKLPNFLIVGAAKSGTTSLYEYLKEHPEVFMPEWKEPAFFAPPEAGGLRSPEDYAALFGNVTDEKAIGEASVAYLCSSESPRKIKDFLGNGVKIIMALRNPVDMAYSLWGHQLREGFEDLSFEDALAKEKERLANPQFARKKGSWVMDYAYSYRASYAGQIAAFDKIFSKDHIKILIYEEFYQDILPRYADLCRFLNIDDSFSPEGGKYNVAGAARSQRLQNFLHRPSGLKNAVKKIIPDPMRQRIRKTLEKVNRIDRPLPPLPSETRKELEKIFYNDVRQLEARIGRSLKEIWF